MKTINVKQKFNLNLPGKYPIEFNPGFHSVSDEVSDHWYTKQFSDIVEVPTEESQEASGNEVDSVLSEGGDSVSPVDDGLESTPTEESQEAESSKKKK